MKILSADVGSIQRYSEHDLRDIVEYFNPSVLLITGFTTEKLIEEAEAVTDTPVIKTDNNRLEEFVFDDISVVCVDNINDLEEAANNSYNKKLCIISSFIEEEIDVHSFETEFLNLDEYVDTVKKIDGDVTHLTTGIEAKRTINRNGVIIHGAGKINDINGDKISCISINGNVFYETLPSEKVGIRAIQGVGWETERKLKYNGYSKRTQLMNEDPLNLLNIDGIGPHYASLYTSGARALEQEKAVRFDKDPLSDERRVYIDIETDSLNPSIVWQIGVYDEFQDDYIYFIQDEDPNDTQEVIKDFIDWINDNAEDACLVSWHGNQFDYKHISSFVRRYCDRTELESWNKVKKADLLHDVVRPSIALPSRSFNLDVVADRLGYERKNKGLTGEDAGQAYSEFMRERASIDFEKWVDYCKDDVLSMKHIYDKVKNASKPVDKNRVAKVYNGNHNKDLTGFDHGK